MPPKYGRLRRTKPRMVFIDVWLGDGDGEIEEDLGELVYMFGRNQLGCQHSICAFGRMKEFVWWEEIVGILRNGRAIIRVSMNIAEIGRREEEDRESPMSKISVQIENGRGGTYLYNR